MGLFAVEQFRSKKDLATKTGTLAFRSEREASIHVTYGESYYSVTKVYGVWPETWMILRPKVDPSKLKVASEDLKAGKMRLISFDLIMFLQ